MTILNEDFTDIATLQAEIKILKEQLQDRNDHVFNLKLRLSNIVDNTCRWLDMHQSKYVTGPVDKPFISGGCQTDLRCYLTHYISGKNVTYLDDPKTYHTNENYK